MDKHKQHKYRCEAGHTTPAYHINYVTKKAECGHPHCNYLVEAIFTLTGNKKEGGSFTGVGSVDGFTQEDINDNSNKELEQQAT